MSGTTQAYANHKKYVIGFHGITFILLMVLLVWAVRLLGRNPSFASAIQLITVVALGFLFYYARAFAMGVQDRVIRLEENLRLTRVLPDDLRGRIGELRVGQIVALRFASDGELPGLVRRVLGGELATQDAIKRAIKDWRPDYARS